jgi:hypothetical protein
MKLVNLENHDYASLKKLLLAGNANFTLHSLKTDTHFTYKIRKKVYTPTNTKYFVSVLTGTDNDTDYTYAGLLTPVENTLMYRTTPNSKIFYAAPSILAFRFLLSILNGNNPCPNLEFIMSDRCARCGRTITTPQSVKTGYGPECIKHINH